MISIDPIEPVESSGSGKKSKGEEGEEVILSEVKELMKGEAAGADMHHHQEK